MTPSRRTLLTIAWLASWALIFVFASSLPGWLAIGLAIGAFAAFLLPSREPSACLTPGPGAGCTSGVTDRGDRPDVPRTR
jgi:hypothetical protein